MTKDLFEQEFVARCQSKMAGLSKDDCPYSDEEFAAYKEGWLAAWQWSIDILAKMMRETKDLTCSTEYGAEELHRWYRTEDPNVSKS